MSPARLGALTALVTLLADQASKLWLLRIVRLEVNQPMVVAPFMEFIVVWNRGISYGLFQATDMLWRYLLIGFSLLAAVFLAAWIMRAGSRLLALGLGLILGGAIGNVIDRFAYGAVFDFAHFHIGSFSWYVFNVADAAIVAGVVILLYDSFRGGVAKKPESA